MELTVERAKTLNIPDGIVQWAEDGLFDKYKSYTVLESEGQLIIRFHND